MTTKSTPILESCLTVFPRFYTALFVLGYQLVWAPFWLLMIVGAIMEGALHMADNKNAPVGTFFGSFAAAGLLASVILSKVMYDCPWRSCSLGSSKLRPDSLLHCVASLG